MDPLTQETLLLVRRQMACHDWSDAELAELVAPRFGIITGFQQLLDQQEALRRLDLGSLAPAQGVRRSGPDHER